MTRKVLIAFILWLVWEACYLAFSGAPVGARLRLSLLEPIFVLFVVVVTWSRFLRQRVRISVLAVTILLLAAGATREWSRYQEVSAVGYAGLLALSLVLGVLVVGGLLGIVWLIDKVIEKITRQIRNGVVSAVLLMLVSSCVSLPTEVEGPEVISHPEIVYPAELRERGVQGLVKLEATIGADGVPRNVHVLHDDPNVPPADPGLEKLSVETLARWKFKPAMVAGRPIERRFVTAIDWKAEK